MTIRHLTLTVLCTFALIEVTQITPAYSNQNNEHTTKSITDQEATEETRALFYNLRRLAKSKLLFGHQASTAYGVGWSAENGRSDVKSVTGSYPAVYGWDIGHLGGNKNLDGVEFSRLKILIRQAYERGGINTISWHMRNPVTGRGYLDRSGKANAVPNIIPGGSHHEELKRRLDLFVEFLSELKDNKGRAIPIIFRPWHENNQRRFWWAVRGDGQDFIKLWHFTVEYLRDTKGVHNLLYAYSPLTQNLDKNSFTAPESGYPGDEYVDIIGIDNYSGKGKSIAASARLAVELAELRGKIAALAEVGPGNGLPSESPTYFFTRQLLEPLKNDPVAGRIAYALVWRNSTRRHFWVPFPGHPDADDFRKFRQDTFTVFEDDLIDVYKMH
ncbi:MAG: beta-mannosidase [Planctomycetes bacterium]|nr:beta-mannosidase [Planctomycetota bacterium]